MPQPRTARSAKRKIQSPSQNSDLNASTGTASDHRFAAAAWDPRFARVPKRARKASADPRFEVELASNPAFKQKRAPVDRFGRPRLDSQKEDSVEDSESEEDEEHDDITERNESNVDGVQPDLDERSWRKQDVIPSAAYGESDLSSDDDFDEDGIDGFDEADGASLVQVTEEHVPSGRATRRLAVIGLDWANTRSVDILASFNCFLPPTGGIDFVEVHPSKLGLQRLADEARFGPEVVADQDLRVATQVTSGKLKTHKNPGLDEEVRASIRADAGLDSDTDRDISEREEDESDDEERLDNETKSDATSKNVTDSVPLNPPELEGEVDEEGQTDDDESDGETADQKAWREQLALRKYEEERLKYYYAVAQFPDVRSADAVYEQCDGVEFAQTGRVLDLRFIPDDMKIETEPRDRAEEVPEGYEPPEVNLSSLNNSSVKLSWDADAPDRIILKKKAFGKHEIDENNLRAYLASSDEDDEDNDGQTAEQKSAEIERKRKLLLGGDEKDEDDKSSGDSADDADKNMGLEITFEPGMLEKGEEIMRRKQEREELDGETPWERRLRRQRERKLQRRKQRREPGEDSSNEDDIETKVDQAGEVTFDDPFFNTERSFEDAAAAEDDEHEGGKQERSRKSKKNKMKKKQDPHHRDQTEPDNDDEQVKDEARRQKGELELLMMDDLSAKRSGGGGSMRERLAARESDDEDDGGKRGKRSRGRRRGQRDTRKRDEKDNSEVGQSPGTAVDVQDSRFQAMFDSHLFAMDPTHPKYKDNATTRTILSEKGRRTRARRTKQATGATNRASSRPASGVGEPSENAGQAQSELRELTAKLKARAKVKKRVAELSNRRRNP